MTCRETSAGSAFTSWVHFRNRSSVSGPGVLSCFHGLIRQYEDMRPQDRPNMSLGQYHGLLDQCVANVTGDHLLSERERASVLTRLQAARGERVPAQPILYALSRISGEAQRQARNINRFLEDTAQRTGTPASELRTRFAALERQAPRARAARSGVLTPANRGLADRYSLGRDVGVVYATSRMTEETNALEIRRALASPQRVTRIPVQYRTRVPGQPTLMVTEIGYDSRNGRVEVLIRDEASGEDVLQSYVGVPAETWEQMRTGDAAATWFRDLRGNPDFQYANDHAAAMDGAAPRCALCGQFADAAHACNAMPAPVEMSRWNCASRWSGTDVEFGDPERWRPARFSMPAIREFRTRVLQGPVKVALSSQAVMYRTQEQVDADAARGVHAYPRWSWAYMRGHVVASRSEDGTLTVEGSALRCSCPDYQADSHCPHVDGYVEAVRTRLDPPARAGRPAGARMTAAEREAFLAGAQQRAEAVATTDWMRDEDTRAEARRTWRRGSEVSYARDFTAFQTDLDAAQARSAAKDGSPAIPYMDEDALGGLCRRGSGKAFGMEIEFDIGSTVPNRREALRAIARDLHAAGLTWSDVQVGYGSAGHRGFTDRHTDSAGVGTWTFETDGSVDGEVVSPGMYDEPETWQKLAQTVEIIRRHGGVPSKRAGAHVHVGTGDFRGNPAAYTELARLMNQHEDVMYRLASDPVRGTHRNNVYADPLSAVPAAGFSDVRSIRSWQAGRYRAINFTDVQGTGADHPEFRLFDSTLDPGAMQAQIKLAVFMTDAARRTSRTGSARGKEERGAHAARFAARGTRRALSAAELESDTATTRSLLDTLFQRRSDKAQMVALWAATKWGKGRRGR
jgi:hypothetical protein